MAPKARAKTTPPAVTPSPRERIPGYPLTWQLVGAAALVMGAGVLHFVYTPLHAGVSRGQGLFFLILGFLQIGWGAAALQNRSPRTYLVGLTLATVMPSALYVVTRYIPAPFSHEAEGMDLVGLGTLIGEAGGAILLVWHGLRQSIEWRSPDLRPGVLAAALVVVGLVAAGAAFGIGLVGEGVEWLAEGEGAGHHAAPEAAAPEHHSATAGGAVPNVHRLASL